MQSIKLGNIEIEVEQKDIKNVHLSVYPPHGKVRIAAPLKMDIDTIRVFAISKLQWIKDQKQAFEEQKRESKKSAVDLESHYFLGKRYILKIHETNTSNHLNIDHKHIHLHVKADTSKEKRLELIENWYREELKKIVPPLLSKWEKNIGVKTNDFGIKKMRTKWGSCNTDAKRIWLNLELAKKPKEHIEYIIVHELMHLLERSHNQRFVRLMDIHMPKWKFYRDELNRLPIGEF